MSSGSRPSRCEPCRAIAEANLARIERAVREAGGKTRRPADRAGTCRYRLWRGRRNSGARPTAAGETAHAAWRARRGNRCRHHSRFCGAGRRECLQQRHVASTKGWRDGRSTASPTLWSLRAIALFAPNGRPPGHRLPRHEDRHADLLRRRIPGKCAPSGASRRTGGAGADSPAGERPRGAHRAQDDPGTGFREPDFRRLCKPLRRRRVASPMPGCRASQPPMEPCSPRRVKMAKNCCSPSWPEDFAALRRIRISRIRT